MNSITKTLQMSQDSPICVFSKKRQGFHRVTTSQIEQFPHNFPGIFFGRKYRKKPTKLLPMHH